MACDLCGKVGVSLNPLNEPYKTEKVADICRGCEKLVNDQLWKIKVATTKVQAGLLKRFIANLREKFQPTPKEPK